MGADRLLNFPLGKFKRLDSQYIQRFFEPYMLMTHSHH
jgi:hypothetical protein